jgi:hypothetical protein
MPLTGDVGQVKVTVVSVAAPRIFTLQLPVGPKFELP